jgi:ABC-type multidrug transport system ATPase subunit/peptidoglycan/LPS O-acetylase OafA/YrhL
MTDSHHTDPRLHAFDAARGFALLLGVAFHAALSFMPGWPPGLWAMSDVSTSPLLSDAAYVSHIFRMALFFFIAGFFARLLYQRRGARGFWANRGKRILVPLVGGWVVLFPLITWIWLVGMRKVFDGELPEMPEMAAEPGAFPLTHLWFLYQLLLIYAGFLAARALFVRLDASGRLRGLVDRAVTASLRVPVAVLALGLPLAVVLARLPVWYYWQAIPTPDRSLVPQLPATVGFGTAFVVGWLVHRAPGTLAALAARWHLHLALGAAATGWCLHVVHATPLAEPGLTKTLTALALGVAAWGWVLGLTGASLRFLSAHSPARRYVADASYWIYLAHLPLVMALQVWVGHWPLHWSVKYLLVLGGSLAVLFASYHLLVRPTFLGQLLNGRRVPIRRRPAVVPEPLPTPAGDAPMAGDAPVASLHGVAKRFGATTALDGVDLEVRGGEVLAVLGPNGAGKSTAIALWLGLLEPDAGRAEIFGGPPREVDRRRLLGVLLQDVELAKELRVRELVALASSYYQDPLPVEEALAMAGISAIAHRPYGKLSGGQKRQAQFAVALCGRPRLLFLDEPTVGLDVRAREALWTAVRALLADGCAVVLTTHYLEEAEALATRVAVLAGGRVIASGSVEEIRSMVARCHVSCESTLAAEEVASWAGVVEVAREGRRLVLVATDPEDVVRRLLAADPMLRRLQVREAGLSEAFNELTQEAA